MKKNKIIITAASLLTLAGLVSCGGASRDVDPQYSIVFANCYSKDATDANPVTPKDLRVFPDWAYMPEYNPDWEVYPGYIDGKFGYVASGDKANVAKWTIDGNTTFKLGEDINFTITFDEFSFLNPIDGKLVQTQDGYSIEDPVYFKIYVADNTYYSYNELKGDFITQDEENPRAWKFSIPGEYVKFSYKVFFSATYLDVGRFGFKGFNTMRFNEYPKPEPENEGERTEPTEFEKVVPFMNSGKLHKNGAIKPIIIGGDDTECYKCINNKVGEKDLSYLITPRNMAAGFTFTEDYLKNLQFFGVNLAKKYTDITDYVNTTLVHYYADVVDVNRDVIGDTYNSSHISPVNQYSCLATLPWVNPEIPEGGLFTYKDGQYALNYNQILVTVKEGSEKTEFPTYIERNLIANKFKILADSKSIKTYKVSYDNNAGPLSQEDPTPVYSPRIKIEIETNEGYTPAEYYKSIFSMKVVSRVDGGNSYFKNLEITKSTDMEKAFVGGYIAEGNLAYRFNSAINLVIDETVKSKATITIDLDEFLKSIAFGPNSYDYAAELLPLEPLTPLVGMTKVSVKFASGTHVTLDMIDNIEIGIDGLNTGGK